MVTPAAREWVTFPDPKRKKHIWHFDVTYLTSAHMCIYGRGCQGVLVENAPEQEEGCCSYGAHASDKKDMKHVEKIAAKLTAEDWQFRKKGREKSIWKKVGKDEFRTRLHDDACIFLNRPGFAGGTGCAFHIYAMRTGVHHSDVKPEVCWQVPLRNIETYDEDREDGVVHHRFTEFARHGWGEGGDEFAWWCTEAPEAFVGREPVYRGSEVEIRKMIGDELYENMAAYLDTRLAAATPPVAHPAAPPVPVTLGRTRTRTRKSA
jgi:hypothetical protein